MHIDIAIDEEKYEQVDESELNVRVSSEEKRSQFDILVYDEEIESTVRETQMELSKVSRFLLQISQPFNAHLMHTSRTEGELRHRLYKSSFDKPTFGPKIVTNDHDIILLGLPQPLLW